MVLTITVPMPENVANRDSGRGHWRIRHNEKRQYWQLLDLLLQAPQLPPPPATPIAKATVRSAMVLRGAMDEDNSVTRHKPLLDWLVENGYLAGDRKKHLRWEGFPAQRVTRKEPPTITLTLTPVERFDDDPPPVTRRRRAAAR